MGSILPQPFAGNELIQVISERPIGAESLLVEQALDPASQAHLIFVPLDFDGPTHLPMPAPTERGGRCACQAVRNSRGP